MEEELRFLETALPEDWAAYPRSLFEAFAAHARMLRDTAPWCAALSREAYEQYVLCPRVNDEDLSEHRELFYSQLWDRVKDLDQEDAALEVNRWCHEQASYQAQDDRTASPLTVYRCGSGLRPAGQLHGPDTGGQAPPETGRRSASPGPPRPEPQHTSKIIIPTFFSSLGL